MTIKHFATRIARSAALAALGLSLAPAAARAQSYTVVSTAHVSTVDYVSTFRPSEWVYTWPAAPVRVAVVEAPVTRVVTVAAPVSTFETVTRRVVVVAPPPVVERTVVRTEIH